MVFANPNYLYLLLLLIPMIGWYVYKLSKSQASLQVSSSEAFEAPGATSWIVYLRHVPFVLRMVAVALLIVILARPQSTNSWSNSSTEGIDIMLAMDISGSMLAQDLKPNRLEAARMWPRRSSTAVRTITSVSWSFLPRALRNAR